MTRNAAQAAFEKTFPAPGAISPVRPPIATLAPDDAPPVASGVHDLQDLLVQRLDEAAPLKWSTRASLGFVVLVCGGFWVGVFLAARLMLR
jgi:hypothetical protein